MHRGARADFGARGRGRTRESVPKNAQPGPQPDARFAYAQDHLIHFYHLHALDWVDVVSALSADPSATSRSRRVFRKWPQLIAGLFRRDPDHNEAFVESGQLGIFANAYWGNPAYKLPPEANLHGDAHYLEALDLQRDIVHLHAIFGGKNPHPHFLVGGVPNPIDLDDSDSIGAVNTTLGRSRTSCSAHVNSSTRSIYPTCSP